MVGTGVRCDYLGKHVDTLSATDKLMDITCMNCLSHWLNTIERNIRFYDRFIEAKRIPPVMYEKGWTIQRMVDRREELLFNKARVEGRIEAVRRIRS